MINKIFEFLNEAHLLAQMGAAIAIVFLAFWGLSWIAFQILLRIHDNKKPKKK